MLEKWEPLGQGSLREGFRILGARPATESPQGSSIPTPHVLHGLRPLTRPRGLASSLSTGTDGESPAAVGGTQVGLVHRLTMPSSLSLHSPWRATITSS